MKIQTAVIFGGRSVEHEVSIITGMQVVAALNREKYEPVPLYITKDGVMYSGEEFGHIETYRAGLSHLDEGKQVTLTRAGGKVILRPALKKLFGAEKPMTLDVAIPAVHGTFVEDGSLQGLLELLGLPYCGCDVLSSAVCMDKPTSKALLRAHGLPVLPERLLSRSAYEDSPDDTVERLEATSWGDGRSFYPVIVKPSNLGSSVGITKARDQKSLRDALDLAFSFSGTVLLEPALEPLREVNVAVLGNRERAKASVCEEPIAQDSILSYADKYQSGGKGAKSAGMSSLRRVIPADISPILTERAQSLAIEAFYALGCSGVVRVDFLMDADTETLYVNELNTLPGSMAFYLWEKAGLSFSSLLDEMISLAFARQRARDALTFTYNSNLLSTTSFGSGKMGAK